MKEQPREAIFVKVVDQNDKLTDEVEQLRKINKNITNKQEKFELPSGPALIGSQWW